MTTIILLNSFPFLSRRIGDIAELGLPPSTLNACILDWHCQSRNFSLRISGDVIFLAI